MSAAHQIRFKYSIKGILNEMVKHCGEKEGRVILFELFDKLGWVFAKLFFKGAAKI